ncbi:MAG: macro domain-containing protein [Burkholderiales bacterium]|jgi:O-acetyl-ADP-ribose deacetylase (regulator of RNase III)|nr:macro domain-containing protein [Burkholderiales bacterium]
MTIHFTHGNLFETNVDAIINTVNCVGVMGKGVALEFKRRWPDNYKAYKLLCDQKAINIGEMFIFDRGGIFEDTQPRFLINFPTKEHWRGKSKLEYIELGLIDLVKQLKKHPIHKIALPPLGCGNGGLDWADVKPLIQQYFASLPEIDFFVFEPELVNTKTPEYIPKIEIKTPLRAIFIKLLGEMEVSFGGAYSNLVLQKLAYFLQEAGLDFQLQFTKTPRGPYSRQMKLAVESMQAQGYLEHANFDKFVLQVSNGAYAAADEFLRLYDGSKVFEDVAHKVSLLIEGFESPYGLEILSNVHYLTTHEHILDDNALVESLYNWNESKQKFPREHILAAYKRLSDDGFINA